ncbi:transcriptional regulator NarP [compost metagenome]
MVANGNTSLEIASHLQISHMTVNTHIRNTYRKLQVRSRAQAVQSAMLRGLI